MSDHPDAITVAKCHPFRGDNFYIASFGSDRSGVEYIRADISAAKNKAHEKEIAVWSENYAALERQLAEAQALIYAARQERDAAEDAEKELAEELRTVKRQLAEAREVKPLEWDDFDGVGAKASAFYQANYLIQKWKSEGRFEVSMSYPGYQTGYDGPRWHDTLEAAKAAAQADYTARILSALKGKP